MERKITKRRSHLLTMLGFLCLLCFGSLRAYAADGQMSSINNLSVTGFFGDALGEQKINWLQDGSDYYLCIPAGAGLGSVKLWFEGDVADGYVMLDGTPVKSGDTLDLSGVGKDFTIGLSGGGVKLHIVQSAEVPSIFIGTESGSLSAVHADKEYKEAGNIAVVKADGAVDYEGSLKHIKGRGNATWGYAKKPYNIKLNKSADLLNMGKEKSWCLLANYTDRSLLRNRIVYNLAEEVGIPFTMDSRNVDLYINGDYMGSYLLTEKIEIGSNRVDIVDLEGATEDVNDAELDTYSRGGTNNWAANTCKWVNIPNDPADITGGYLLEVELNDRYAAEISGFVTSGNQSVVIKYPEYASENQVKYIAGFYQEMEEAVYSDTGYNSLGKHFSEYLDVDSIARMYVLQEFAMNLDSGITSFYFYKDSALTGDGKIHAAPVWDFDVALGNYYSRDGVNLTDPTQWWARRAQIYNIGGLNILAEAVSHTEVMERAAEIWEQEFKPAVKVLLGEETDYEASCLKSLDAYTEEVAASAAMNFVPWKDLLQNGTSYGLVNTGTTYEANMEYLSSFISRRREFLDEGLYDLTHPPVVELEEDTILKAAENIIASSILQAESTSDEGGGQSLGYCDAGAYAEYNINVKKAGDYEVTARVASLQGSGAFSVLVDGQALAAFRAVNTGGWQNWVTLDAQTVSLTEGEHKLRIEYTESGSNLNWLRFTRLADAEMEESVLIMVINAYKNLDMSLYTEESAKLLAEALAEGEKVAADSASTDQEIARATENILRAAAGLIFDTSKLEGDIEAARAAAAAAQAAAAEAKEAAEKAKVQAVAEVKRAMLSMVLNIYKELHTEVYTAESAEALAEALTAGQKVLDDTSSAEQAMDDAAEAILKAAADLALDTSNTDQAIQEAKEAAEAARKELEAQKAENEKLAQEASEAKRIAEAAKAAYAALQKQDSSVIVEGESYVKGNYTYRVVSSTERTVEVTGLENADPAKISIYSNVLLGGQSYRVVSVAASAFKNNKKVTSVTIGKNVETIGSQAFAGCDALKKVTIKSSVLKEIGSKAFSGDKKLSSIVIRSKNLKKVGKNTFKGIYKKAVIRVPSAKYKSYVKLLAKKGQGSHVKIKK